MLRLFFAGDFCCCPSTANVTVSDELKTLISGSDFSVCTFETPLKPDEQNRIEGRLYNNDDAVSFLLELGFDAFSVANNHAFDYGEKGFIKTINAFNGKCFGAGTNAEAYNVKIVEIKGKKIGLFGLCFAANEGVFDGYSDINGRAVAWINDLRVNHVIIKLKKEVDYLIVMPHDGIEYIDVPLPETIARYRDFIDYGADAVIASHPHCPQGWEFYNEKPIFYSLGNFFFNSKEDYSYRATNRPHWYEGECVILEIEKGDIKPRIIHTRNVDNMSLIVDKDPLRENQMTLLCNYLIDVHKYSSYLDKIANLYKEQELKVVDSFVVKRFIKRFVPDSLVQWFSSKLNDLEFKRLFKNETRRNLFLRGLIK